MPSHAIPCLPSCSEQVCADRASSQPISCFDCISEGSNSKLLPFRACDSATVLQPSAGAVRAVSSGVQ
eukprot:4304331-Alexandrium_andersonii.AAC.1